MWLDLRWPGKRRVLDAMTQNRTAVYASYPGWMFGLIGRREMGIFSRFRGLLPIALNRASDLPAVLVAGSRRAFEITGNSGRFAQEGPCRPRMSSKRIIGRQPHAASNSEPHSRTWKAAFSSPRCITRWLTGPLMCTRSRSTRRNQPAMRKRLATREQLP
jgi:hypothetical protein